MKAKNKQLPKIVKYFEEDRKIFVKKYFKKDIEDINEYKIYKFILLSNRNVSGLNIDDISIRDIYSLERILEEGYLEIGQLSEGEGEKKIVNNEKYTIGKTKNFLKKVI